MMKEQRVFLEIQGAVQGIGFRPFIYRLAQDLGLKGWVSNNPQGVALEIEGPKAILLQFLERMLVEKPSFAFIQTMETKWLAAVGYQSFEIRQSNAFGAKSALILPDIAPCSACLNEIFDPENRRYQYPFTNCTNCGPRFSILTALPYDRPNTTMDDFQMCSACQAEYETSLNRRFHAQPNACAICGPNIYLTLQDPDGRLLTSEAKVPSAIDNLLDTLKLALEDGKIIALKGLGGFQLLVDAQNEQAVKRLRELKHRSAKPFALLVRDLAMAQQLCWLSPQSESLLAAPESPIVLLQRREGLKIAENIARNSQYLGLMLPSTPLHHLLMQKVNFPIVATSGNLRDEPLCIDNQEALRRLGKIADLFLLHNRPIARHIDDSVLWLIADKPQLLRRARGYAPLPIQLKHPLPTILAVGAHQKNSIALSLKNQIFLSQHIGDLETPEAMAAFERIIADFLHLYEAKPTAIAHDLHPDYFSSQWAKRQAVQIPLIAVQHHHAHFAACLTEHNIEEQALGIVWDGTGYGLDGTIWGGEFLLGTAAKVARVAHLRPFHLPGGEAAIREPRRVALALLWEIYGRKALEWNDLVPVQTFREGEKDLLVKMLQMGFNSPQTTSIGRLFDGISALIGLQQRITFEGQAAIMLENSVDSGEEKAYPIVLDPSASVLQLDWHPLIEAVLDDLRHQVEKPLMATRFHLALVQAMVAVAQVIGEAKVVLTGGCFQNRFLTEKAKQQLEKKGFEVILHRQVPPNDGGISLGQVAVAAARLKE